MRYTELIVPEWSELKAFTDEQGNGSNFCSTSAPEGIPPITSPLSTQK